MGVNSQIKVESNAAAICSRSFVRHVFRVSLLLSADLDIPRRSASVESGMSPASTHCMRISSDILSDEYCSPLYSYAVYRSQPSAWAISFRSEIIQLSLFNFTLKFDDAQPQRRASSFRDMLPAFMHCILIFCLVFMWLLLEKYWHWRIICYQYGVIID